MLTFGTAVDELSCVHAFDSDEILSALFESVHVSEDDLGEGSTTARVVHDVLHNALDVPARTQQLVRHSV